MMSSYFKNMKDPFKVFYNNLKNSYLIRKESSEQCIEILEGGSLITCDKIHKPKENGFTQIGSCFGVIGIYNNEGIPKLGVVTEVVEATQIIIPNLHHIFVIKKVRFFRLDDIPIPANDNEEKFLSNGSFLFAMDKDFRPTDLTASQKVHSQRQSNCSNWQFFWNRELYSSFTKCFPDGKDWIVKIIRGSICSFKSGGYSGTVIQRLCQPFNECYVRPMIDSQFLLYSENELILVNKEGVKSIVVASGGFPLMSHISCKSNTLRFNHGVKLGLLPFYRHLRMLRNFYDKIHHITLYANGFENEHSLGELIENIQPFSAQQQNDHKHTYRKVTDQGDCEAILKNCFDEKSYEHCSQDQDQSKLHVLTCMNEKDLDLLKQSICAALNILASRLMGAPLEKLILEELQRKMKDNLDVYEDETKSVALSLLRNCRSIKREKTCSVFSIDAKNTLTESMENQILSKINSTNLKLKLGIVLFETKISIENHQNDLEDVLKSETQQKDLLLLCYTNIASTTAENYRQFLKVVYIFCLKLGYQIVTNVKFGKIVMFMFVKSHLLVDIHEIDATCIEGQKSKSSAACLTFRMFNTTLAFITISMEEQSSVENLDKDLLRFLDMKLPSSESLEDHNFQFITGSFNAYSSCANSSDDLFSSLIRRYHFQEASTTKSCNVPGRIIVKKRKEVKSIANSRTYGSCGKPITQEVFEISIEKTDVQSRNFFLCGMNPNQTTVYAIVMLSCVSNCQNAKEKLLEEINREKIFHSISNGSMMYLKFSSHEKAKQFVAEYHQSTKHGAKVDAAALYPKCVGGLTTGLYAEYSDSADKTFPIEEFHSNLEKLEDQILTSIGFDFDEIHPECFGPRYISNTFPQISPPLVTEPRFQTCPQASNSPPNSADTIPAEPETGEYSFI